MPCRLPSLSVQPGPRPSVFLGVTQDINPAKCWSVTEYPCTCGVHTHIRPNARHGHWCALFRTTPAYGGHDQDDALAEAFESFIWQSRMLDCGVIASRAVAGGSEGCC